MRLLNSRMISEVETMWKEVVMAKCRMPSQHISKGSEEDLGKSQPW
jgi:hypothetical protein